MSSPDLLRCTRTGSSSCESSVPSSRRGQERRSPPGSSSYRRNGAVGRPRQASRSNAAATRAAGPPSSNLFSRRSNYEMSNTLTHDQDRSRSYLSDEDTSSSSSENSSSEDSDAVEEWKCASESSWITTDYSSKESSSGKYKRVPDKTHKRHWLLAAVTLVFFCGAASFGYCYAYHRETLVKWLPFVRSLPFFVPAGGANGSNGAAITPRSSNGSGGGDGSDHRGTTSKDIVLATSVLQPGKDNDQASEAAAPEHEQGGSAGERSLLPPGRGRPTNPPNVPHSDSHSSFAATDASFNPATGLQTEINASTEENETEAPVLATSTSSLASGTSLGAGSVTGSPGTAGLLAAGESSPSAGRISSSAPVPNIRTSLSPEEVDAKDIALLRSAVGVESSGGAADNASFPSQHTGGAANGAVGAGATRGLPPDHPGSSPIGKKDPSTYTSPGAVQSQRTDVRGDDVLDEGASSRNKGAQSALALAVGEAATTALPERKTSTNSLLRALIASPKSVAVSILKKTPLAGSLPASDDADAARNQDDEEDSEVEGLQKRIAEVEAEMHELRRDREQARHRLPKGRGLYYVKPGPGRPLGSLHIQADKDSVLLAGDCEIEAAVERQENWIASQRKMDQLPIVGTLRSYYPPNVICRKRSPTASSSALSSSAEDLEPLDERALATSTNMDELTMQRPRRLAEKKKSKIAREQKEMAVRQSSQNEDGNAIKTMADDDHVDEDAPHRPLHDPEVELGEGTPTAGKAVDDGAQAAATPPGHDAIIDSPHRSGDGSASSSSRSPTSFPATSHHAQTESDHHGKSTSTTVTLSSIVPQRPQANALAALPMSRVDQLKLKLQDRERRLVEMKNAKERGWDRQGQAPPGIGFWKTAN
ncbi:unnamed protein product [Amoebophrya sp. A120]|nr:unnamed protein product [Amoebophrya sp. A120]|eukprot:GSA120T00005131001.1